MAGLTEAIYFIDRNDMNDYISRLTQEADMEKKSKLLLKKKQKRKNWGVKSRLTLIFKKKAL